MEEIKRVPAFSIVTVVYNAEKLIEGTMESIFNQTCKDYEYIVIDGNSTDKSMSIIEKYSNKIDIIVSEPDKGIYDAMNKAIKLAKGRYLNFMNCGDFFADKTVLSYVVTLINDDYDVIYGNTIIDTVIGKYLVYPEEIEKAIYKHMPFCHQSVFVKTDTLKNNPFDLKYRVVADYNMFYNLYRQNKSFLYVNYTIAKYQNDGIKSYCSYEEQSENASINQSLSSKMIVYIKAIGTYIRPIIPFCIYAFYRRCKYSFNPRYVYIGK